MENVCLYNCSYMQCFNFAFTPIQYSLKVIWRVRKNMFWHTTNLQHNLISELLSVRCNHKQKKARGKGFVFKEIKLSWEYSKMWLERAYTWHKCSSDFCWFPTDPGWDKSWCCTCLVSKLCSFLCQEINSFWAKGLAPSPRIAEKGCDSKLFKVIQSFAVPTRALKSKM